MRISCALSLLVATLAMASEYIDGWGPSTGTPIPDGEFTSHLGESRTVSDLMGDKGLLLVFARSANW